MLQGMQLLNQISDELNKDLDLDNMLQRVINLTVSHFKAANGSIMLFDETNRVSKYILQRGNISDDRAHRIVGRVLDKGFAGWVLKHRRGDVIADTLNDSRWYTFPNQPYTARSVVATPLIRRQRVVGVLTINHVQPYHFKEDDLVLLNAIASQAAIALENARLFQEAELERAKLSAIIDGTQDAIIVTQGHEHQVVLLNPAAETALGIGPDIWFEESFPEICPIPELVEIITAEPPTIKELQISKEKTFLVSVINIPQVGRLGLLHDISALKALDNLKTEFVTTFTHDLAAPLATIKSYTELLSLDGDLTDRQKEDVDSIRKSTDQMRTLITDLLELTRLESLKHLVTRDVSLKEYLQKTMNTFLSLAAAKNIQLSLQTETDPIVISGNPRLISRAIDNLVENAIKYTKVKGHIWLNLTTINQEAHIAIKDSGIGIPPNKLEQVFDKFYRAHAANNNEVPGSGLGLAIVKTIVERHNGRIWVESEVGKGSTFTIALPYKNGTPR